METTDAISELREIVARLRAPGGCPWDREQTHASLRSGLIEEAYEVVEAIDRRDDPHFREELGDLLLQVVMHSQIAAEELRFDLDQVAREIAEKLIRRHPHVFGADPLADSDAVLKRWDEIKRSERQTKGGDRSILEGVSKALPALMRAEKVQKRAAQVGFDWENLHQVVEKIREETAEVEEAMRSGHAAHLEEEIGDLLFSVVNLSRKAKLDAELTLTSATNKFVQRFQALEAELARRGIKFENTALPELDAIWDELKRDLSSRA
jgi:MazG family protein